MYNILLSTKMAAKPSLNHLDRAFIKPYKLPKLNKAKPNPNTPTGEIVRWFVYYSYRHPETGLFKRFKVYGKLNQLKNKSEREKYARALIKHYEELLKKGYNPFLPDDQQVFTEISTLGQAIDAYIAFKKNSLKRKTMNGYRSGLSNLLKWLKRQGLSQMPLAEITVDDVERYFTYCLTERKWAATTHNSELNTIRAFFSHWQERGIIRINPAKRVKRLRERIKRNVAYNDEQIQLITDYLQYAGTPKATQLYQFIRWIYYSCIRPNELLALKVSDILWQTNTVLVPAHASKNSRSEPVDISPGLAEVIDEMNLTGLPAEWYIFGNQAKGVTGDYCDAKPGPKPAGPNFFSKYYRQALDALGFSAEYTMYGWKHTRNVHLYMHDKDLLRIMRHNRHTDPKVTMRYLRSLGVLLDGRLENERRI